MVEPWLAFHDLPRGHLHDPQVQVDAVGRIACQVVGAEYIYSMNHHNHGSIYELHSNHVLLCIFHGR
jgi:hypothetical protein